MEIIQLSEMHSSGHWDTSALTYHSCVIIAWIAFQERVRPFFLLESCLFQGREIICYAVNIFKEWLDEWETRF